MTNQKDDFKTFYPTSVMETGYDILPIWVLKMIMFGIYVTGKVPFENILLHGLVRDKEGQKISKSKGNVIDPIEMADRYGADALRMGLLWGALVENDVALSEENINAQRKFANKIWNVARFVIANRQISGASSRELDVNKSANKSTNEDDKWIMSELKLTIKEVTKALDEYCLNKAAEEIYDFVWHKFADKYIENCKLRTVNSDTNAVSTLYYVLDASLRLLHPFMPFVTEQVWHETGNKSLLITTAWPKA
jgi:valyl-tRNA synthetase